MQNLFGNEIFQYICAQFDIDTITEIRMRKSQKIQVSTYHSTHFIPFLANKDYIKDVIDRATGYSRYAYESEITDGYINYKNGIRIGLVGCGKVSNNNQFAYSEILSLCIRIPHRITAIDEIVKEKLSYLQNILIISPPRGGKTTLLRAISLIYGNKYNTLIVDEREEITCGDYVLSKKTDIVVGLKKSIVYENIIRTMSPELVICDEIFSSDDIQSIKRLILSGISVVATYHSKKESDVPIELLQNFNLLITLNSNPTPGSIVSIKELS